MSVKIVQSIRGRDAYEINGYLYIKHKEKVNPLNGEKTIYLQCSRTRGYGCRKTSAVLVINGDSINLKCCSPIENHNHPPPTEEVLVKTIKTKMRKRLAEDPMKTPKEVYNEVVYKEISAIESHKEEFMTAIPKFESVKTVLFREKNKLRPELPPTDKENFKLEGEWTILDDDEKFILFETDKPDKMVAFATTQFVKILCNEPSKTIYVDSTFKTIPEPFEQLYTIHAVYKKQLIPFVYILLSDRTEDTHVRMFELLEDSARQLDLKFEPEIVVSDYEASAMHAIRKCFPQIIIQGSQFHFFQTVWRQFKELGLLPFETDESIKKVLIRCAALPLCKLEDVDVAWVAIIAESVDENHPAYKNVERFKTFMIQMWLDEPTFSPHVWNNYNNFNAHTNSYFEAWHNTLNITCNKKKATIYDLITAIKSQQTASKSQVAGLDMGINKQPRLNSKCKQLDTIIGSVTSDYDSGEIMLIDFLTAVGYKLPLHA